MKRHLDHIRALEQATGESILAGIASVSLLLIAAWGWCWILA